jgi:transposase
VQRFIRDKFSDQMKLPFASWTTQAVRELIHKKHGKCLGLSTMRLYLKWWGFSAQKPLTVEAIKVVHPRLGCEEKCSPAYGLLYSYS